MGINDPAILFGNVMHARLFPKKNHFRYGIYYMVIPLDKCDELPIAYNRFGTLSFYDKDHGARDGSSLEKWARRVLHDYGMNDINGRITLICMPRVMGYVFNPVSFWICHDHDGQIRAILCEVHNTFGEHHTYVCAHSDHAPIKHNDTLKGEKLFHVSPMLKREGHYTFRFDLRDGQCKIWIDFYDADHNKQLLTALCGDIMPMTKKTCAKAFWTYPLITIKAITLIHWQAVKLLAKGIKYITKPAQKPERTSSTDNLTKI